MSALSKLTQEERKEIYSMLCPGCKYNLPDYMDGNTSLFIHSLPDTEFQMVCKASNIRGK